jgi:hypothetical protein
VFHDVEVGPAAIDPSRFVAIHGQARDFCACGVPWARSWPTAQPFLTRLEDSEGEPPGKSSERACERATRVASALRATAPKTERCITRLPAVALAKAGESVSGSPRGGAPRIRTRSRRGERTPAGWLHARSRAQPIRDIDQAVAVDVVPDRWGVRTRGGQLEKR